LSRAVLWVTPSLSYIGGEHSTIANSTFYGQGDGLVGAGSSEDSTCTGEETLTAHNSIFHGDTDYFQEWDITFLFYQEDCADLILQSNYNIAFNTKNIACGMSGSYVHSSAQDLCLDPLLRGPLGNNIPAAPTAQTTYEYGMSLSLESPAVDSGDDSLCPPRRHLRHAATSGRRP
jgi:hypothetical protein